MTWNPVLQPVVALIKRPACPGDELVAEEIDLIGRRAGKTEAVPTFSMAARWNMSLNKLAWLEI